MITRTLSLQAFNMFESDDVQLQSISTSCYLIMGLDDTPERLLGRGRHMCFHAHDARFEAPA